MRDVSKTKIVSATMLQTLGLSLVALSAGAPPDAFAADGVFDLGTLSNGSYSYASGISGDGSIIVGASADGSVGDGQRAFMWTPSGMTSLGTLNGGVYSAARAISRDGTVVVGQAADGAAGDATRAFSWTSSGGMVSLGVLNGGTWSTATGASNNGNAIIGTAWDGSAGLAYRAFRWTQAGGMVSLGVLNGGNRSFGWGVSDDGSVVVGDSQDGAAGDAWRAFRWTQAGGMVSLGVLNGGSDSSASAVSADGTVVVGSATDGAASNAVRAIRWTQAGGMVSLGALNGGGTSAAMGVSGNGNVVVGYAFDSSNAQRAFRWAQGSGLITVEDWLRNNNVSVPTDLTRYATATNNDGSVVVGQLANNHAFIARVAPIGSGLIDTDDYNRSLACGVLIPAQTLNDADLVLHGAHGSPMRGLLKEGQSSISVTGDWGRNTRNGFDTDHGVGEIGYSYGLKDGRQVKLALGTTYSENDCYVDCESRVRGVYLVPELIWPVAGTLHATLSGYYNRGEADFKRGYQNAGVLVHSSGSPDVQTYALRARLDWLNAFRLADTDFTPYSSLTVTRTHIDGYTETGGGFPARWDSRKETSHILRGGMDAIHAISSNVTLLGRLEAAWRADNSGSDAPGEVIGLYRYEIPGISNPRTWIRAAAGMESSLAGGTGSFMLNTTTQNGAPNAWLYASWRKEF